MSTRHIKQVTLAVIAVLALSASALAHDRQRGRGGVEEAAAESFGFTEEQVEKIREIRRERAPRGQSDDERESWRADQQAKVEAVLTDEQRAKIARLNEVREQMRDYALAARMGLVEAPNRSRLGLKPKQIRRLAWVIGRKACGAGTKPCGLCSTREVAAYGPGPRLRRLCEAASHGWRKRLGSHGTRCAKCRLAETPWRGLL